MGLLVLRTATLCTRGESNAVCTMHNFTVRYIPSMPSISVSLNQHTWLTLEGKEGPAGDNRLLRMCTYNIWNTNPPAWVYQHSQRWLRYRQRISHLATTIAQANVDVIMLQEVRLDTSFSAEPYGKLALVKPMYPPSLNSFTPLIKAQVRKSNIFYSSSTRLTNQHRLGRRDCLPRCTSSSISLR